MAEVYIDVAKLKTLLGQELDFLGMLEPRRIYGGDSSYPTPDLLLMNFSFSLIDSPFPIEASPFVLGAFPFDSGDTP